MRIFLSHPSHLKPLVREFKDQLPRFLDTWLDEESLSWGDVFPNELKSTIQSAVDFVIIFLDRNSLDSMWVKQELEWALVREKELDRIFILPILIEDIPSSDLPNALSDRLQLRLSDFSKASVESLGNRSTLALFKLVVDSFSTLQLEIPKENLLELRKQELNDFRWFFGGASVPSIVAVFQDTFAPELIIQRHINTGPAIPLAVPSKKEDPDQAAVFEDLQAGAAIARLCAEMNAPFEVQRDGYQYLHNDKTIVAIGLHNGASHKATKQLCLEGFVEIKTDERFQMANFCVEGVEYTQTARLRRDVSRSETLILRTIDARSRRPYFVCGGHDGQGTAAAGIFLAERWRELLESYDRNHDPDHYSLGVVIEFDHDDPVNGLKKLVGTPSFARIP